MTPSRHIMPLAHRCVEGWCYGTTARRTVLLTSRRKARA